MIDLDTLKRELDHAKAANSALPQWKKDALNRAHQIEIQFGYVRKDFLSYPRTKTPPNSLNLDGVNHSMPTERDKIVAATLVDTRAPSKILVKALGEKIGFGYLMGLCEEAYGDYLESHSLPRGGAHTTYCCSIFLVPCPACPIGQAHKCDWCCGTGRVTKRVAKAIREINP